MALAEAQAAVLLQELRARSPPVPTRTLTTLPRVRVRRDSGLPVSALAKWDRTHWLIVLNSSEPFPRQRFSLAHELKHIIDSPFEGEIYPPAPSGLREWTADYFAASLLMPREWIEPYASVARQDIRGVARVFGVSPLAVRVRLATLDRHLRRECDG